MSKHCICPPKGAGIGTSSCTNCDPILKECICHFFDTQIINATEGSYQTSVMWYCDVHGNMHKEFPDNPFAPQPIIPKPTLTWES